MTRDGPGTFRTVVRIPGDPRKIGLADSILSLGSCFAENIGELLESHRFRIVRNPTGLLYNPASISGALLRIVSGRTYARDELFEHDGRWHSWDHHGDLSSPDADECLARINASFARAVGIAGRLDALIVTLGTAYAYFLRDSGAVVANCHKVPGERFDRRLLGVEEIAGELRTAIQRVRDLRPGLHVITSVSPVRHLRDDPHENAVSKAHLLLALDELRRTMPDVYYFPAYEIMMDDLRDYRFYGPDMTHPNETAVGYIRERFTDACLEERAKEFMNEYAPVIKLERHRRLTKDRRNDGTDDAIGKLRESIREKYPEISQ